MNDAIRDATPIASIPTVPQNNDETLRLLWQSFKDAEAASEELYDSMVAENIKNKGSVCYAVISRRYREQADKADQIIDAICAIRPNSYAGARFLAMALQSNHMQHWNGAVQKRNRAWAVQNIIGALASEAE